MSANLRIDGAEAELDGLRHALASERAARAVVEAELRRERAGRTDGARAPLAGGSQPPVTVGGTGLWELDLTTREVTWSDAMYDLLGYARGSVSPAPSLFEARVHPDDLAELYGADASPAATAEYRVLLPDGSRRWLRGSTMTDFDDRWAPVRMRGIVVDVTDEKQREFHRERLAEVASRTRNSVVVCDTENRITWVNEGFTRLTEYSLDEVRGRMPGSVLQGPSTSPEARAVMRAAVAAREPFTLVVLNYTRSGRQYWVELETRPVHDARGRFAGFISLQSDVTEQRLAASADNLARRVAALLLQADTVEAAGAALVRELVRELDIRAAQVWTVEPRHPTLSYLAGASAEADAEAWVRTSQSITFSEGEAWVVGVGAPGAAWGTRRTYTRTDFWTDDGNGSPSRRAVAAKAAGIRTVSAVPVMGPDGVLAVIEVGGTHGYPGHERIPSLIERVAEQFAAFVLKARTRDAFKVVFQGSPDGMLLVDARGAVTDGNARARALFGEVAGRAVGELIDGADALVAEALEGAHAQPGAAVALLQRVAHRPDGATFSAEVTVSTGAAASGYAVILAVRDLSERHRLEAALSHSLREQSTLVKEVHHRVKNNLQIISSILALQAEALEHAAARGALIETSLRVRSIALVHQQLYAHDDLSRIDLGDYARSLCEMLRGSLDTRFELTFEAAPTPVELSLERAVPCGIVLNELITNAIKHGCSADDVARVRVRIEKCDDGFAMLVADGGPGIAAGRAPSHSMGVQLLAALVRQLRARMTVTNDGGARVRVEVPGAVAQATARG
jgi:PAS domain S-box-containing protein